MPGKQGKRIARFGQRVALPAVLAAVALAGCTDFTLNPPPVAEIRADAGNVVDPREIVVLVPGAAEAAHLRRGAARQGFSLRAETDLSGLRLKMLRFTIPQPLDGAGAIAALETIEPSATAGVNHAYQPAARGAGRFDYANDLMNWPEVACHAAGPVGMLDTGVDATIPELRGARIVAADFERGTPARRRHGTEVATLLADPRRLRDVTIYSASVIGTSARGQQEAGVDSLLAALDWMASNGVGLVNISLSGPYNKLLDRGIDTAAAYGMTIVAAVGNDGSTASPRYPAALDNVIAVTAVDARRAIYRDAVRGGYVDVAAPGVDVALSLGGRMHLATGTSIATPFVTARIAADPGLYRLKTAKLRAALAASTEDLGAPGPDPVFGAGLLMANPGCGG